MRLTKNGKFLEKEILYELKTAAYPARSPAQNVADLRAQIAALTIGVSEMRRAAAEFGDTTVLAFLRLVQKNAEQAACRLLQKLKSGKGESRLDDGSVIQVNITVTKSTAGRFLIFAALRECIRETLTLLRRWRERR